MDSEQQPIATRNELYVFPILFVSVLLILTRSKVLTQPFSFVQLSWLMTNQLGFMFFGISMLFVDCQAADKVMLLFLFILLCFIALAFFEVRCSENATTYASVFDKI